MITEDYVSFETAKLLKEKGFDDIPVYTYYLSYGGFYMAPMAVTNKDLYAQGHIAAPTLQMVMKWLRNIHGLFIHIGVIREASCWLADIQDIKGDVSVYPVESEFPNYEEACEAGIMYCLENLI